MPSYRRFPLIRLAGGRPSYHRIIVEGLNIYFGDIIGYSRKYSIILEQFCYN